MTSASERYLFKGKLVVDTALHAGCGEGDERTDACVTKVLRFSDGKRIPLIPGSSLKGALRSHVERIASALGLETCLLSEDSGSKCLTVNAEKRKEYLEKVEKDPSSQEKLLKNGSFSLCDTCRLFGSPFRASKVRVRDLLPESCLPEVLPVRHGVGIDRDTGAARHGIKFDFEYVPPQVTFTLELSLEGPEGNDLPLLCLGLREMQLGNVDLGGNATRGAGKCHLELESIGKIKPSDKEGYLKYLSSGEPKSEDVEKFLTDNIGKLLKNTQEKGSEGIA